MGNNHRNIYLTARVLSGKSQKTASKLLSCEDSTLRDYEKGKRIPPNEMVVKMMEAYEAKWLGYLHLRASPIGQIVLPEIKFNRGFASSVLSLRRTVNKVVSALNDLMDIAESETVENNKDDVFRVICQEIEENVSACLAILINDYKKKKSGCAGTQTTLMEKNNL